MKPLVENMATLRWDYTAIPWYLQDHLEFWIRKGVDGFRIDAIHTLFEPEEVVGSDEPPSNKSGFTEVR